MKTMDKPELIYREYSLYNLPPLKSIIIYYDLKIGIY